MSPAPAAIRTDGSNAFARYSMQVRVPKIARDTLDRNPGVPPAVRHAVEGLARAIEGNAPIPPPHAPGPEFAGWQRAYETHQHERWLDGEWFYAELAFYRELLAAFRYWETGRDPFEPLKEEELNGDRFWARLSRAQSRAHAGRAERLSAVLGECLWANRVDLSYTVAASRDHAHEADLLVDDRAGALPLLARGGPVHVVLDNAGTELCLDLVLVGTLLEQPEMHVTLHLKIEPTFVSDALPKDLWRTCDALETRAGDARALALRLRAAFDEGRLELRPDAFWSGPSFLRAAPDHVAAELASAAIVVFKGDANYRRVVGDATWPAETPFASACAGLGYPLLCLRTMKSDSLLGLPRGLARRLDAEDPNWRVDGRRGVAQAFLG